MTKTFIALNDEGSILYRGRGKTGAAQKAIDALDKHRAAIAFATGRLHGNPYSMGRIEIDGVEVEACGGYYDAVDMAR